MPNRSKLSHKDIDVYQILDVQAEMWLRFHVPLLSSQYLNFQILETHQTPDGLCCMVERINLVIFATLKEGEWLGFVAAQVDCDQSIILLHMIYVLPDQRRRNGSRLLIEAFEVMAHRLGCQTVVAGVTNTVSRDLFQSVSSESSLKYVIKEPEKLHDGVQD